MDSTIPCNVYESDQFFRSTGADPTKAVPVDLCPPVILEHPMLEAFGVETVDFIALERPSPFYSAVGQARGFRRYSFHAAVTSGASFTVNVPHKSENCETLAREDFSLDGT